MSEGLNDELTAEAHQLQLRYQGYTLVPNAIPHDMLRVLVEKYDALLPEHGEVPTGAPPGASGRDVNRLFEIEPVFADLMDLPSTFPIIERYMNGNVTLLSSAIANYVPGCAPPRVSWHRDGPYVRLTCLLSDVEENGGAMAVLPGTHHGDERPDWLTDADGVPRIIPGEVRIAAPAGTCVINNTLLWHTSTANELDHPRKLVWIVYKMAEQELTPYIHLRNSQEFVDRQIDPLRMKLCGTAEKEVAP